jgi:hypothetical protein
VDFIIRKEASSEKACVQRVEEVRGDAVETGARHGLRIDRRLFLDPIENSVPAQRSVRRNARGFNRRKS